MHSPSPYSFLFDLDGTLVDSLQDLAEAANRALAAEGHPTHPVDAYNTFVGDGITRLFERALPPEAASDTTLVDQLVDAMKAEYATRWKTNTHPYPGIMEMLQSLQEQGIRLGVFSNKPEAFTVEMVAHLFPDILFATVRGAREGIPVKPDPTGAREICAAWETDPSRVIYVGDTDTDMRTGVGAGFTTVGVTWGFRDREELEATGAQFIAETPSELLRVPSQIPDAFLD